MKRPVTGGAVTKSVKDALLAAAQVSASDSATEAVVATGSGTVSTQQVVKDLPGERIPKWVQEASVATPKAMESGAWVASGLRDRGLEAAQPARSSGAEGLVQIQGAQQGSGGAMGVDGVVAGAAAEGAGSGFAEDVKYWVGQDLQKAELSLDGIGTSPVEISISLQGNEAHVAFRSDEMQTREALSNAGVQLQEALNRQGMSLAGVTVGGSQTGDSQGRSGQEKDTPWRRGRVEGAVEGVAATPIKPLPAGRSIDLFV
jgi:flagellar hook-length control protein FliK